MATLSGVYPASVLDTRDPDGLARVLVRVSGVTDVTGGDLWARVATMMAGRNRGTWFVPEVGDEVLVAFERGDAKVPYVVGALWNAKARPPAGQRITLQDGPGSVRIEDANGNAVTLSGSGVTVNAAATLTLNASAVQVNAGMVTSTPECRASAASCSATR